MRERRTASLKAIKRILWAMIVLTVLSVICLTFFASVRVKFWRFIHVQASLYEEGWLRRLARRQLEKDKEEAAQFWFEQNATGADFWEPSPGPHSYKIVDEMPNSKFAQCAENALISIHPIHFNPTSDRYRSFDVVDKMAKLVKLKPAIQKLAAKASNPKLTTRERQITFKQLYYYMTFEYMVRDHNNPNRHFLTKLKPLEVEVSAPAIDLEGRESNFAGLMYILIKYGCLNSASFQDSRADFGFELLFEFLESEMRRPSRVNFNFNGLFEYSDGRYLNWEVATPYVVNNYDLGLEACWAYDATTRMLHQAHRTQTDRFFAVSVLVMPTRLKYWLRPEEIARRLRKIGFDPAQLNELKTVTSEKIDLDSLSDSAAFQLRFKNFDGPKSSWFSGHYILDPGLQTLGAMHSAVHQDLTAQSYRLVRAFTEGDSNYHCTSRCSCCGQDNVRFVEQDSALEMLLFAQSQLLGRENDFPKLYSEHDRYEQSYSVSRSTKTVRDALCFMEYEISRRAHKCSEARILKVLSRALDTLGPFERSAVLDWLFVNCSVRGREKYLIPHVTETQRARVQVVNDRIMQQSKRFFDAALQLARRENSTDILRMSKVAQLNYQWTVNPSYELNEEQTRYFSSQEFYLTKYPTRREFCHRWPNFCRGLLRRFPEKSRALRKLWQKHGLVENSGQSSTRTTASYWDGGFQDPPRDAKEIGFDRAIRNLNNESSLPGFGDLAAHVFFKRERVFNKVFGVILAGDLSLTKLKSKISSEADIIRFCRLCHKLGPIALSEKEFLLKQLNHERDRVVIAAILALSRVDWPANFMLERLTEIINDKSRSGYVRGAAICAMRRFEGNPKVGERLREFIDSKSLEPLLRDAAKRSLPVWEYFQQPVPSLLDWPKDH